MTSKFTTNVVGALRPEVTVTTPLLITPEQFSAGSKGILSMEYITDGMRQTDALSSKVVFSRGVAGEICVISIEPVSNPKASNRVYGPNGAWMPVTFITVAITGDNVRYLVGEGINTAGDYVKNNGTTVAKKGAGYGVAVGTADVDSIGIVVNKIVRDSLSADYGRAVADASAWMPYVATWHHDARFVNGGQVTGASKNVVIM